MHVDIVVGGDIDGACIADFAIVIVVFNDRIALNSLIMWIEIAQYHNNFFLPVVLILMLGL